MYTYELKNNRCTFTFEDSAESLCRSIFATKLLSGMTLNTSTYKTFSFHAYKKVIRNFFWPGSVALIAQ